MGVVLGPIISARLLVDTDAGEGSLGLVSATVAKDDNTIGFFLVRTVFL